MPRNKEEAQSARDEGAFEQAYDERGRMRLDRGFTPEEADEQDAEHRRIAEETRSMRWPRPGRPVS